MYERQVLSFPGAENSWVAATCWLSINGERGQGVWELGQPSPGRKLSLWDRLCVIIAHSWEKIYWKTAKQFWKSTLRWLLARYMGAGFVLYNLANGYSGSHNSTHVALVAFVFAVLLPQSSFLKSLNLLLYLISEGLSSTGYFHAEK